MSEQLVPMTFAEMNETLRLMIRESQEQRIKYEQRCAEEDKRRAEYERLRIEEAARRAEEEAKRKEAFAAWEKRNAAWERRNKETNKKISALGHRMGEITENMVFGKGRIYEKFESLGYEVKGGETKHKFYTRDGGIKGEVDILLWNDDTAFLIEVKTTLEIADVKVHLERMEKYRQYLDAEGRHRRIIGAVAGAVVDDKVLLFAQQNGMYTIVPSGKTFNIVVPEGFKPKEW